LESLITFLGLFDIGFNQIFLSLLGSFEWANNSP